MNSTTAPKAIEPDDVVVARADERLVHAYDQIARADEQLARLNEQLAKLEQEAKHQPSAVVGHRPSRGRRALRGFIGLLLAACIFGFAFVSQSSYGEAAKSTVARWAPQLMASSFRMEKPAEPAQPGPSGVQLAAATPVLPQSIASAQTAPEDVAPTAAPDSGRAGAVAPDDGARSRKRGAGDRAAQGEPGTSRPRQCQGHRGTQGEPGANDAPDRQAFRAQQGFRAEPAAQDIGVIGGCGASNCGSEACAGASVAASQSAAAAPDAVAARRRPVVVHGGAATETRTQIVRA